MKVPGLHREVHTFEKPWFTTWESAAALWVSLVGYWILRLWQHWGRRKDAAGPEQEPLLTGEAHQDISLQVDKHCVHGSWLQFNKHAGRREGREGAGGVGARSCMLSLAHCGL